MIYSSFPDILLRIQELSRSNSRIVVAIDGRGGAGKSSLARNLVKNLPKSAHIEHDWFHLPKAQAIEGHRFDRERLISDLISPFRSGDRVLSFLRYNWGYLAGNDDGFHDTPITIEDMEVLVIEGCETSHEALNEHIDLSIWLDTEPALSMSRGMRRDIEEYKLDPDKVGAAWKEWTAREAQSLAQDDRRARADIILQGVDDYD